ncbi:hypothetical protein [Mongoliitalea lutea]|uniref:hypothetical protein n=1 Tax=Mongoliitalea lutea TaxID=849756 RepID=UPI001678D7DC|nr:hypothetical protein [Mongoliitalea lutea]
MLRTWPDRVSTIVTMGFPTHGLMGKITSQLPYRDSTTWGGCPRMARITRKGEFSQNPRKTLKMNMEIMVAWLP